ncbi:glycerophosphodiester phosphodiesterase [Luteolibacter luteus]|uniref:glycerophosphodiester phosphodiesterase n=1 Tax=Luteolibacter luteus TaxID=2728835 RepID=A0A858RIS5_9BACT|nr:glycerophosphodiester phosphodiesterase [Luteolibacter luteus]QJE96817.1 glycerophosphodiester phosphodiesterase [Luteolibacter luteus]
MRRLIPLFLGLCTLVSPAAERAVFAHRGASGYLPEHSFPAKAMAHAQGADFLEQDVVLTKDEVPIVLHDIHLDTTTDVAKRFPDRKRSDGRYYAIDFTLAEIKQLSATQRFDPKTGKAVLPKRFPLDGYSYPLHTLEEEIRFIQGLNFSTGRTTGLFTEIKQPTFHAKEGRDIARIVYDLLRRYGYGQEGDKGCWIQCFEQSTLRRFREEFGWKGQLMMILTVGKPGADGSDYDQLSTPAGLQSLAGFVNAVFPNSSRVVSWDKSGEVRASSFTSDAHAAGLWICSGVVNRDALPENCPSVEALHAALFETAGVDAVCSDFPDLSVQWIKEHAVR